MTTNQKILVALGLGAVAFYVYRMRGRKDQSAVTQPQSQDSKVVDEGKNPISKDPYGMPKVGIPTFQQQEKMNEQYFLFEALKQKYGNIRGGAVGDRITTKYGTYENRVKSTGGRLGKGMTTTWDKI
jgi:hypothetical protein